MTESEVRKLLRQMKEQDSQTAFRDFYNMTYDRLFRIAYYYVKQKKSYLMFFSDSGNNGTHCSM